MLDSGSIPVQRRYPSTKKGYGPLLGQIATDGQVHTESGSACSQYSTFAAKAEKG